MANNPTFYVDRGTVYKCKRGTLKSSFVSEMLIKHRSPLTLYQNLLAIFPYTLDAKNIFELGRWIVNLPEIHLNAVIYLDNLHANTCHFSKRYHQVTLFCIIRMTSRNTISVYVLSPLFHLGGGGYGRTRGQEVQRGLLFPNTSRNRTCRLQKNCQVCGTLRHTLQILPACFVL